MKRFLLLILPLALVFGTQAARSQEALGIAAVVNDKPISVYDLNMRIGLVMVFSGISDSIENRQRLAPQVLRTLIDDELKRQAARRLRVSVSVAEINTHIRRLEKLNRLEKGTIYNVLESNGIDRAAMLNQIRADIGWSKLVGELFARRFRISDEEIDEVIAGIERNKGKPEFLVSEIFLPVPRPENAPEVLALARRLVDQMKRGTEFPALARNFSKSVTATRGGDLGWNRPAQLGRELGAALTHLQPGEVSPPVRVVDGYTILMLRDKRISRGFETAENADSAVVNLQQLFIPLPKGAGLSIISDAMTAARKIGLKSKSCADLDDAAKKIGSPMSGNLGDLKIDSLAPQQRTLVRGLPPLKASDPLRTADGVLIVMVCRRDEPEKKTVTLETRRDQIASRLFGQRLELAATQHLRDLRRAAFVDVRL